MLTKHLLWHTWKQHFKNHLHQLESLCQFFHYSKFHYLPMYMQDKKWTNVDPSSCTILHIITCMVSEFALVCLTGRRKYNICTKKSSMHMYMYIVPSLAYFIIKYCGHANFCTSTTNLNTRIPRAWLEDVIWKHPLKLSPPYLIHTLKEKCGLIPQVDYFLQVLMFDISVNW